MFTLGIGVYCIYRTNTPPIYLTMVSNRPKTHTQKFPVYYRKSDFNISWQKFMLIGMTIMLLREQMVKVRPFHQQDIMWVFLSLNNQIKQKHNTEEVIVPSLIWLAVLSQKYENKRPTQTINLYSTHFYITFNGIFKYSYSKIILIFVKMDKYMGFF